MTTDDAQRSVLLIGKSQLVLGEAVAGLRNLVRTRVNRKWPVTVQED